MEIVVALVILSIISEVSNQISSAGRVVIDRLAMELRNAVPESVRVSTARASDDAYGYKNDQCIEYLPVKAATNYLNPIFRPNAAAMGSFDVLKLEGSVG